MARLPIPGSDKGTWGDILNEYLSQTLEPDGVLKPNVVTPTSIAPNAITAEAIAPAAITPEAFAPNTIDETIIADGSITNVLIADNTIQEIKLDPAVQAKLNQTAPVTSVASKTGDVTLGLTDLTNTTITTPTNGQVLTYDSTTSKWKNQAVPSAPVTSVASKTGVVTLIKDDVGLNNVDNTSDATKNAATATLTNKTIDADSNTISNLAHGAEVDDPSSGVHGVSGSIVGTSDSQTLTNKTLTGPKVDAIYDTNGALNVSISSTASAVNWLNTVNSATGQPLFLRAQGSDTDVDIAIRTKGNGSVQLRNGSNVNLAIFNGIASSVNYPTFSPSATGSPVSINVAGSDSSIGMNLVSKGTGTVQVNGVAIVTISGAQTLTNKTLSSPVLSGTISGTYTFGGTPTFPSTVVTTTGTQTLTNKTLTDPRVSAIRDLNGALLFNFITYASAVNYITVTNQSTGNGVSIIAAGSDANVPLSIRSQGSSDITMNAGGYNTLQIKTATTPVNYWRIYNSATGVDARLDATGSDTNVSMDFTTRGAGIVKANGVEVVTVSGTQTLTNKTISGASNTLSAIPQTAVTNLGTDLDTRLLSATFDEKTYAGANLATNPSFEDTTQYIGNPGWFSYSTEQALAGTRSAKFTATSSFVALSLVANKTGSVNIMGKPGQVFYLEAWIRGHASNVQTSGGYIYLRVRTYQGDGTYIGQIIAQSLSATTALNDTWTKMSGYVTLTANTQYFVALIDFDQNITPGEQYYVDQVVVREVTDAALTNQALYGANTPSATILESALPTTAVTLTGAQTLTNKTITSPVLSGTITGTYTFGGTPTFPSTVVTTTGDQTLTNKTLTAPRIDQINDVNGAMALYIDAAPSAVNRFRIDNTATGSSPVLSVTGSDANLDLGLTPKGAGVVRANGVEVATISGTQTLTNKTISQAQITGLSTSLDAKANAVAFYSKLQAGGNICTNPSFEDSTGWRYSGIFQYSTEQARTGTQSLKFISNGSTYTICALTSTSTGYVYIPTYAGQVFHMEVWIRGHTDNTQTTGGGGGLGLRAIFFDSAGGGLGTQTTGAIAAHSSLNDVWTKLSGDITVPATAGLTSVAFEVVISCSVIDSGDAYYFDDAAVYLADPAKADASTAVTLTDTQTLTNKTLTNPKMANIMDSSGGLAGVVVPSTTPVNYFEIRGGNTGQSPYIKGNGSDSNVGLNLLTKGAGIVMVNSVEVATIDDLLFSQKGGAINLCTNPGFEDTSYFLGNATYESNIKFSGSYSAKLVGDGINYRNAQLTANKSAVITIQSRPYATYYMECWIYGAVGNVQDGTGLIELFGVGYREDGTYIGTSTANYIAVSTSYNGVWTKMSGFAKMGAYAQSVRFGVRLNTNVAAGETYYVDECYVADVTEVVATNQALYGADIPASTILESALPTTAVTTSGTQTLTNKTLTDPRVDFINDGNGNESIRIAATASAVNYLWVRNSASGSPVLLQAEGDDANIGVSLVSKGTGKVFANGAEVVTVSGTQTLTNKILTNPTINSYTEGVVVIGTVTTSHTFDLTNGTKQVATLTASTACTFTMPPPVPGKSFQVDLKQAASTGNGTASFTGVKWPANGAPTITATAGKMDKLYFDSDGTSWYGSYVQGYTP